MAKEDKFKLFISYSRDDLKFADQLDTALDITGYDCTIDRQGIHAGEDWKRRLGSLILEADTVIFVLSPTSAVSKVCEWEVEETVRCGKRILPVLCRPLDGVAPPGRLSDLNFIYFYDEPKVPGSGFGSGLARLISAISTDLDWLREHTRLLQRATEWEAAARVENRMLSGGDIQSAKEWAARRPKGSPEPTSLHLDYIRASEAAEATRQDTERQRLAAMAAAQEARAEALAAAEAALKRAARARQIITGGSLIAAVVLAAVAGWAWVLRQEAEVQRALAYERMETAKSILDKANEDIRKLTQKESKLSEKERLDPNDYAAVLFHLYEGGVRLGLASSMNSMGLAYEYGSGIPRDYAKARQWFEKAVESGFSGAMTNIGRLFELGRGVAQDYAKAIEWYERSAAEGNPIAMSNLGVLYANGRGAAQDYAKAREWYEKAAAKGHVTAMMRLGDLYAYGRGVAQDGAKAREWYEKVAAKGNSSAMVALGRLYAKGLGVPQDYAVAREWYEKAADKGDPSAMLSLGGYYANGLGVPQDYAEAREWYEKAAAKGHSSAMVALGRLYAKGLGVPQDDAKAREWFGKVLRLVEAEAADVEDAEVKEKGRPGKETAEELIEVAWDALLAHEFAKALDTTDRSKLLDADGAVSYDIKRAHALMFLGRAEEARALHSTHKGKNLTPNHEGLWDTVVLDDFAQLRQAGLDHPLMAEIETLLKEPPRQ